MASDSHRTEAWSWAHDGRVDACPPMANRRAAEVDVDIEIGDGRKRNRSVRRKAIVGRGGCLALKVGNDNMFITIKSALANRNLQRAYMHGSVNSIMLSVCNNK